MHSSEHIFFLEKLQKRLAQPLPGEIAHQLMAASSRLSFTQKPNYKTRKSAVLVLFYPFDNELHTCLILRPPYDGAHGGQVAFPGGQHEKTDETLIRTALREAQEEIGIRTQDVTVLGPMTELYIPVSNYHVLPVVGFMPRKPDFFPDPVEVAEIIEVNIGQLLNPELIGEETLNIRGLDIQAPMYYFSGQKIWGATAMMISELKMILEAVVD